MYQKRVNYKQKNKKISRKKVIRLKAKVRQLLSLLSIIIIFGIMIKLVIQINAEKTIEKNIEFSENMKADDKVHIDILGIEKVRAIINTSNNDMGIVTENTLVDNSYFDDAVFIGDSRTEGLILNTELSNAVSYTHKGLMVNTVFTKPIINKNGDKLTVMEALKQTEFSKVYLMLGINETGWPYNDIFIEKYAKIIDSIKDINSNAIIYIQEILPVTNSVSSSHEYIKNEKINEFNELIRKMANEKGVYYLDVSNAVSLDDGSLPEDAAYDGIHLKKEYCEKWLNYLKTHTITRK
ncbi:GDSL-type esterase/lipase family protein [Anaerorhabdus sp.]|uniref:GDSL-type esterase/lipase family protein n=2 Tax=Anaerorhabdus sp. TaxID=1872524 RepID=UPI002FC6633D